VIEDREIDTEKLNATVLGLTIPLAFLGRRNASVLLVSQSSEFLNQTTLKSKVSSVLRSRNSLKEVAATRSEFHVRDTRDTKICCHLKD
jgi:hypothetical protein